MPFPENPSQSILFIAGDVSGDVHTATVARKLLARHPARALHALGGPRLREVVADSARGQFLGETSNCSAIGLPSAVKIYLRCRSLRSALRRFLRSHRVDVAVLCDWGAFNRTILADLHARQIPILYYFPPGSWQRNRIAEAAIVEHVSRVATPFRWSAETLQAAGCRAEWVGHPALENVHTEEARAAFRQEAGVQPGEALIALLPGSRMSELRLLGPKLAHAAAILARARRCRFLAVLPRELAQTGRRYLGPSIGVVTDCATDLLAASDAAIVKVGTATIEAAVAGVPQVAIYDVSYATRIHWLILRFSQRIRFVAMPNIILERDAVPELLGPDCSPTKIAAAVTRLLDDEMMRSKMLKDYASIRQALGSELALSATERTAQMIEEMLAILDAPERPETCLPSKA